MRVLLLCLAVFLPAGCAITHQVNQQLLPQPETAALVDPWPLSVGLHIPPAVSSRVFAEHAWRLPAGESIATSFRWGVERLFTRVVMIDQPPSGQKLPSGLAGVIELTDVQYQYGMPGSLRYEIALYSGQGDRLDSWSVMTPLVLWNIDESSFSASMYGVGSELAYAMRNLIAQFMVRFADRPAVRTWLAGNGVSSAAVRPAFHHGGAAPRAASRILLVPDVSAWLHTDADRAMRCLGNRLAQASPPFEVVPAEHVRLEFFPWLEPSTAPKTVDDLRNWLNDPAFRNKMDAIAARYLLEFHGGTKTDMPGGGILCGAGYGGGGCLGFAWGSRESSFSTTLLDMRHSTPLDTSATQRGGVYVPAFGLPIPLVAPTETRACEELGQRIHTLLMQGSP